MKTLKLKTVALLVTVILLGTQTNIFAQQRNGMGNGQGNGYGQGSGYYCNNIPGITDEQTSKMQELRVVQMKSSQVNQNQMREKRAHLTTLQTSDKVDMSAINTTIDEITALQNSQWKKRAAHKQAVRNVLTAEQKVYYDANNGRKGHGNRHAQCNGRRGRGNGNGGGYGNGQGYGNSNWSK